MLAAALAFALAAPALAQQPQVPASRQAREAIASFGRCVAERSPAKVASALTMDFRSHEYRSALRALGEINRDCHRRRSTMRSGGLPFAAAIAEALLRRNPEPLNVRLVRAAAVDAPTFGPSDKLAMCMARSDADRVAALLTSAIASPEEAAAANALSVARTRCLPAGAKADLDAYGLRSILATASYRLIAAARTGERG